MICMKSILSVGGIIMALHFSLQATTHPRVLINAGEIAAIKAKVKAGEEPWKSAAAKAISIANGNLSKTYSIPSCYDHYWGSKGVGCSNDAQRRAGEVFGEAFQNVAMAWHLTGEKKYVDWSVKNINSWFLDPKTYMKPDVPRGTTVGIDASFSGVIAGVDMIWPALDADLQTKVMAWFKALNTAHHNHRDAGSHNRGDWWASAATIIGQFVGDNAARDVGIEQIRKRLSGLKKPDAAFTAKINETIKGNYSYFILPNEGKGDNTICYNYFDLCSIVGAVETARHAGIDLYNFKVSGDPVSRFEGLMNYYGALKLKPTLYPDFSKYASSRGDRFLNWDFKKAFSIFEVAYNYKANKVYMDVVNQQKRPITFDWIDPGVFLSGTLTHARGAYTLSAGTDVTSHRRYLSLPGNNGILGAQLNSGSRITLLGRRVESAAIHQQNLSPRVFPWNLAIVTERKQSLSR